MIFCSLTLNELESGHGPIMSSRCHVIMTGAFFISICRLQMKVFFKFFFNGNTELYCKNILTGKTEWWYLTNKWDIPSEGSSSIAPIGVTKYTQVKSSTGLTTLIRHLDRRRGRWSHLVWKRIHSKKYNWGTKRQAAGQGGQSRIYTVHNKARVWEDSSFKQCIKNNKLKPT